jgi:hypothetical protein
MIHECTETTNLREGKFCFKVLLKIVIRSAQCEIAEVYWRASELYDNQEKLYFQECLVECLVAWQQVGGKGAFEETSFQ